MLPQFKGIEFKALGVSLAAYPGDVELNIGRFGITALWGAAVIPGLFIRTGDQERHWEWPWSGSRGARQRLRAVGRHSPSVEPLKAALEALPRPQARHRGQVAHQDERHLIPRNYRP